MTELPAVRQGYVGSLRTIYEVPQIPSGLKRKTFKEHEKQKESQSSEFYHDWLDFSLLNQI